jgi:hypothetical protein
MGNFSRDTFDPLKRYASVRLQQGVPLLDADWNEMDDIRRSELRTFLKWFIGDGVPSNNDGFRIEAISAPNNDNDFMLVAGGTSDGFGAGRYLVNGLEVFITTDTAFTAQPLHEKQGDSAQALASKLGVAVIKMPPLVDGNVSVYLDVWEREVGRGDDDQLVNPLIGVETCVRIKREWVVRVRPGTNVPEPGDSDYVTTHSYAPLAVILRAASRSTINPQDISDRRQTRLTMAALEGRLRLLEQVLLIPTFRPSPKQFTPKLGPPDKTVTLLGNNFTTSPPIVRFGDTLATLVGTPTSTQIVATVPRSAAGSIRITVQTIGGTAVSDDTFTVLAPPPAPTLAAASKQFTPKLGATGNNVTLFGNNLNLGNPVVQFGTTTASIIGTPTATQIEVAVPSMATGSVQLSVQTSGGTVTSTDSFSVLSPPPGGLPPQFDPFDQGDAIFQFEPGSGPPGTTVTLFGKNFNVGTPTVRFGTVAATIVPPATSSGVTVLVPDMLPRSVIITVETSAGSDPSTQQFAITAS